jgi:hypothetical protein
MYRLVDLRIHMGESEVGYHIGGLRGRNIGCGCVGKEKRGYVPTRGADVLR